MKAHGTWKAHSVYNSIYTVDETSDSPEIPLSEAPPSAKEIPTPELSDRTTRIGKTQYQYDVINYVLGVVGLTLREVRDAIKSGNISLLSARVLSEEHVQVVIDMFKQRRYGELEQGTMDWIIDNIGLSSKAEDRWNRLKSSL